jgi:DNA-binding MarR family transcriptional regulator
MKEDVQSLSILLVSELMTADQLLRARISKALPRGMELSHFLVLNHLTNLSDERSPAQLAQSFHLTKGAMTNTLNRLEWAGYVHIRPDWDDGRRKMVAISPAGHRARDQAIDAIAPVIEAILQDLGADRARQMLPILRDLRIRLEHKG